MKLLSRKDFLEKSVQTLAGIWDMLAQLPQISVEDLNAEQTALIIVDMVNGFAKEGALSSPRVEELIPEITDIMKKCDGMNITKVAFADCHTSASPEFDSYPEHCMAATLESEIVDEIKKIGDYNLIPKNSTNGFHEETFQKWLSCNSNITTFIITGDCTDICVQQFATTLKTWFNKNNRRVRIIVPINAVDTYDIGMHEGDLINVMALYNMIINGIDVVDSL